MQKKRKDKLKRRGIVLWLMMMVAIAMGGTYYVNAKHQGSNILQAAELTAALPAEDLKSSNAILVRLADHTVLMQKNEDATIYPASLTKMMTAILALENLSDLQEKITLPNTIFQGLNNKDAATAGFRAGERVKAIDLLYGVLLPSGAECCLGLAVHIAGSEQNFVRMMNQKAVQLGMVNTHFTNTHGLQDNKHYTTVKDLAILLSYALQNHTFREIFISARYSTQATNKHPDGITFKGTLFEKLGNPSVTNGKILGGKTGYTAEAGLCLASLAAIKGEEYILVTAGAKGTAMTEQHNITDARKVYNHLGRV